MKFSNKPPLAQERDDKGPHGVPGKLPVLQTAPLVPTSPGSLTSSTIPATTARSQDLVRFDHQSAELRWTDNRWELHSGNVWLKDFGIRERDAREALHVIHRLRLTERGTIGHHTPIMEYWLSEGEAPQLVGTGLRALPIDLNTLRVDQIHGQWVVRDSKKLLFNFGLGQQDAQQAVDVIRRYGFAQIGYVGYPTPTMIYFLKGKQQMGGFNPLSQSGFVAPESASLKPANQTGGDDAKSAPGMKSATPSVDPLAVRQASMLAKGVAQLGAPPREGVSHLRFDPREVALRKVGSQWKLYVGNNALADCGSDDGVARQALGLLQSYGCNEKCTVGEPSPSFSYFLVNGHAPRGVAYSLRGRNFRPEKATVKQLQGNWYVCDGTQPLIYFGDRKQDAERLQQAIRRYQFDFISQLGPNSGSAMTFLIRSY